MRIVFNGKDTEVAESITLQQLLEKQKIEPRMVACELNEKIVAVFRKVFDHLDEVMDHADDDVTPGFDGALYGVG